MSPNSDPPQPNTPEVTNNAATDSYARKLNLALMSVLRDKGLLSDAELQTILLAVNRSVRAEQGAATNGAVAKGEPPSIDMNL